jgi:hypothetical protein
MTSRFIERMQLHWESQSRPCTNALVQGWTQLEQAVESATTRRRWQVVQLPTGTGKTEALIVLCSTPAMHQHPGALVLTRFTKEADSIVSDMNRIAGYTIALAAHQHTTVSSAAMMQSPVLVITHAAYKDALREAYDRPDAAVRLDLYHCYHQVARKWLIVDEAFSWIDAYEADVDELSAMCSALTEHMNDTNLRSLSAFVSSLKTTRNAERCDNLLCADHFTMLQAVNLDHLRLAIKELPTDAIELWRHAELHLRPVKPDADPIPTTFRKQYAALLSQLQAIQQIGRGWVSRRRTRTRLHSAKLLLDTKRTCGVILDATASTDRSYDLLGSDTVLMPRPYDMRSYKNVTVHVSRPHSVGKEHLSKCAATDWPAIARRVGTQINDASKVLVITHKDIVASVKKHGLKCGKLHVAHWGSLDGKNDWRTCDVVVIYGLPYLDDIAPTDLFHGSTGLWSRYWFEGQRRFGDHPDMKIAIKNGFIAKCVLQGINRGCPRTIIDEQGNCPSTDVFIFLPTGKTADVVLASIREEMPGVNIAQWHAISDNKKALGHNEQRLLAILQACGPGTYTKSQIIVRLAIAARTFERMSIKLQMQDSVLMRELAAIGVEYRCAIGRGKEACFIKH